MMQVEIKIEAGCTQPRAVIIAGEMTEEVAELAKRLTEALPGLLTGFRGDTFAILEQARILRIYSSDGKVTAATDDGEYQLRLRLYELEGRLDHGRFVRISHSEIINLSRVRNFDLSTTGTICVRLSDGSVTYVSRRYVSKIKEVLGI